MSALGLSAESIANYTPAAIYEFLISHGPLWVTTDEDPGAGFSIHGCIIEGIFGDGTSEGTSVMVVDPSGGTKYNEIYADFVSKYEQVLTAGEPRIQIVHL